MLANQNSQPVDESLAQLDHLYSLSTDELLEMARAKGFKFPKPYQLPYSYRFHIENRDEIRWGGLEDFCEYENVKHLDRIHIHCVIANGMGAWRFYLKKESCERDILFLNKRHIIVAMSSNDPRYPVLI